MKILNYFFIALIKIYKIFISPFFVNSCKFEPTCSTYALECFRNYNFFKALIKTSMRLLKCNPWFNTGGLDRPEDEKAK
tara:strand:- start:702 stop:938 length:237 start_codon:yes stop_codon:yes gene_type:complete